MFLGPAAPVTPSVQFSSVAQSCPTLCNPMNRSTCSQLSPPTLCSRLEEADRCSGSHNLEKTSLDPRVWVVKAAGEQESVPIFRTCPKEGYWVGIPLSQLHWMPGNSLITVFLGEKGMRKSALFPWQWKIYIVWLFCFRGSILESASLGCTTASVWLRGSAKTLRSAQLDSSLGSTARWLCDSEQVT